MEAGAMWCARLSEGQLNALKELVRSLGEIEGELEGALEALELSRWDDLPEAELPWEEVASSATLQGISEADVIWDMSGRKKEPAAPRSRGKGARQSKRPTKRTRKPANG
jgi:hypothetical protein